MLLAYLLLSDRKQLPNAADQSIYFARSPSTDAYIIKQITTAGQWQKRLFLDILGGEK